MDLDERKLKILTIVVDKYVASGEPVSSKAICDSLDISVSSATVRSELAGLTSLGLLEQPHTSSGRIPSDLGYRVYVNTVMNKKPISMKEQQMIDDALCSSIKDPDSLLKCAAEVLAEMTKCAVASVMSVRGDVTIKTLKLIKISDRSSMIILVMSTGTIKNRIFCCDFDLTDDLMNVFQRILDEIFMDVSIENVTPAFIQTVAASLGELAFMMTPVLMGVFQAIKDVSDTGVNLEGEVNLLFIPELRDESINGVLTFLSNAHDVASYLLCDDRNLQVIIGNENKRHELNDLSVIISRYKLFGGSNGAISIIGSTRMDYARFMPSIEYTSDVLARILREIIS